MRGRTAIRLQRHRSGFTLIELIVVVVLVLFLAGLAARFLPTASSQAQEANTGVLVQGWLNLAKQRALRDQAPRGVRLWNKNGDLRIVDCEYVELPDPYSSDKMCTDPADAAGTPPMPSMPMTVLFQVNWPPKVGDVSSLTNGYPASQNLWLVQKGDYLSVNGGQMHQITNLALTAVPGQVQATLNSRFPSPIYPIDTSNLAAPTPCGTSNYYIQRAPRPVGEDALQLPVTETSPLRGIVIDLNTNSAAPPSPQQAPLSATPFTNATTGAPWNYIPVTTNTPYVDIMFNPSGSALVFIATLGAGNVVSVTPAAVPTGILNLWVRTVDPAGNPSNNYFAGDPTLVSVHLASGFVGAYAPNSQLPLNNPYTFVQ